MADTREWAERIRALEERVRVLEGRNGAGVVIDSLGTVRFAVGSCRRCGYQPTDCTCPVGPAVATPDQQSPRPSGSEQPDARLLIQAFEDAIERRGQLRGSTDLYEFGKNEAAILKADAALVAALRASAGSEQERGRWDAESLVNELQEAMAEHEDGDYGGTADQWRRVQEARERLLGALRAPVGQQAGLTALCEDAGPLGSAACMIRRGELDSVRITLEVSEVAALARWLREPDFRHPSPVSPPAKSSDYANLRAIANEALANMEALVQRLAGAEYDALFVSEVQPTSSAGGE